MIEAYDSYTYSYYCMVVGCAMLMGPMAFCLAASIVIWIYGRLKKK